MNAFLEEALKLCRKGFSVIPLSPSTKIPPAKFPLHLAFKSKATEEDITKWWEQCPTANVGVCLGKVSGVFVCDVDPRHNGNPEELMKLSPTERVCVTGRGDGGKHFWYTYPQDCDIRSGKSGIDGVDIQSDGKYVVVPPSIHPDTKRPYRWEIEDKEYLPSNELKQYISSKTKKDSVKENAVQGDIKDLNQNNETDQIRVKSDENERIAKLLLGVADGDRNDALTRITGYFAGKSFPIDIMEAVALLWRQNNEIRGSKDPFSDIELHRTITSVYNAEQRKHSNSKGRLSVLQLSEFMEKYSEVDLQWMVDKWLPSSTVVFVTAQPGSYKTWLSFDMAVSISCGVPFLGRYPVNDPGPVLIFQQEDYFGGKLGIAGRINLILKNRLELNWNDNPNSEIFSYHLPPDSKDIPMYLHDERNLRLDNKEIMESLEAQIDAIKPKLVIIDPLYSVTKLDDFMLSLVEQMIPLKKLRDKYHCSFMMVGHMAKLRGLSGLELLERSSSWGSMYLDAAQEMGWLTATQPGHDGSIFLKRTTKMGKASPIIRMTFNMDTEVFPYKYEVTIEDEEFDTEVRGEAYESENSILLTIIAEHEQVSYNELMSISGMSKQQFVKAIERLSKAGEIKSVRGKGYMLA